MPPEVEARSSMYSPIRADRWSCGQVITFLLETFGKEEPLSSIARKLKVHNPRERPSLVNCLRSRCWTVPRDRVMGREWLCNLDKTRLTRRRGPVCEEAETGHIWRGRITGMWACGSGPLTSFWYLICYINRVNSGIIIKRGRDWLVYCRSVAMGIPVTSQ